MALEDGLNDLLYSDLDPVLCLLLVLVLILSNYSRQPVHDSRRFWTKRAEVDTLKLGFEVKPGILILVDAHGGYEHLQANELGLAE